MGPVVEETGTAAADTSVRAGAGSTYLTVTKKAQRL